MLYDTPNRRIEVMPVMQLGLRRPLRAKIAIIKDLKEPPLFRPYSLGELVELLAPLLCSIVRFDLGPRSELVQVCPTTKNFGFNGSFSHHEVVSKVQRVGEG
jgi:hypothetical protein